MIKGKPIKRAVLGLAVAAVAAVASVASAAAPHASQKVNQLKLKGDFAKTVKVACSKPVGKPPKNISLSFTYTGKGVKKDSSSIDIYAKNDSKTTFPDKKNASYGFELYYNGSLWTAGGATAGKGTLTVSDKGDKGKIDLRLAPEKSATSKAKSDEEITGDWECK